MLLQDKEKVLPIWCQAGYMKSSSSCRGRGGGGATSLLLLLRSIFVQLHFLTFVTRVGRESDSSMLQYAWYMYYSLLMQCFQNKIAPKSRPKLSLGCTHYLGHSEMPISKQVKNRICFYSHLYMKGKMPFALWALISFTPQP
jgi:hypothetical protein